MLIDTSDRFRLHHIFGMLLGERFFVCLEALIFHNYSKTCLKWPLKKNTISGFQDRLLLNAGQKYCRMLQESILQYFPPSLSYRLSLRPLFCLFLSGCLRRVLLYSQSVFKSMTFLPF